MSKNRCLFGCVLAASLLSSLMPVTVTADTPGEIEKRVLPSMVLLIMQDSSGKSIAKASGFIIRDGIIATSMHVIKGATQAHAKLEGRKPGTISAG